MYTNRHDFQSRTVHQGSDSRTTYPRYHQPLPVPLLSSQADHEVGTTGKGLQSLHQSPTRLAQLVDSFLPSRDSTLRHPFITSLDKQSERYRTDGAEAVWLMVRCVDGAKQFGQLTVAGRCAQGRGGSREGCKLCMLPDTGERYLSTSAVRCGTPMQAGGHPLLRFCLQLAGWPAVCEFQHTTPHANQLR